MDELIKFLNENQKKATLFIVGLLCHLSFGCIYIYFYNKELFLELDIFRLLIVILASTFPIFISLVFVQLYVFKTKFENENKVIESIVFSLYSMCYALGFTAVLKLFYKEMPFYISLLVIGLIGIAFILVLAKTSKPYTKEQDKTKKHHKIKQKNTRKLTK